MQTKQSVEMFAKDRGLSLKAARKLVEVTNGRCLFAILPKTETETETETEE